MIPLAPGVDVVYYTSTMTTQTHTGDSKMTWKATNDGKVVEAARTKADLMWLLTTTHEDVRGHATRTAVSGLYYYTSPRGKIYTIRREGA